MDGLCLLCPWALGPQPGPCPPPGLLEGMIQAELGEALASSTPCASVCSCRKHVPSLGSCHPPEMPNLGSGGCVPRSLEGRLSGAPLGGGTPGGPVGLCQSLSHPQAPCPLGLQKER